MLDWVIVGGGVQGTRTLHALAAGRRVRPDRMLLLDADPEPLGAWKRRAEAVGVSYLRSPSVLHLGVRALCLEEFARSCGLPWAFEGEFKRPLRSLFEDHALTTSRKLGVSACRRRARVAAIRPQGRAWRLETDLGSVTARRVVLAVGPPPPHVPAWASRAGRLEGRVLHAYELEALPIPPARGRVAVVGAGVGAAEAALALARRAPGRVMLLARRSLSVSALDVGPGWGDLRKSRRRLGRAATPEARRALIERYRRPGTIPRDVRRRLLDASALGSLALLRGEIVRAELASDDGLTLELSGGERLDVARVVLATGFANSRPGGALVDDLVEHWGLPTAPCTFPWLGPDLAWAPGLHVVGALAELELGPAAPNIAGAWLAGERLVRVA